MNTFVFVYFYSFVFSVHLQAIDALRLQVVAGYRGRGWLD